jgi:lipopolysaccharide transport system permease protein
MQTANEAPASFRSSARRPGPVALVVEAIHEVLSRQRLIRYLVAAEIKKKGADSLLGNLWWILDPLLQMVIYLVLLTVIFQRSTPDFALFLLVAILPWKWFASSIGDAASSVVRQERLIKQIQFPKIVLPMAAVTAGVVSFIFGLVPLFVMLFAFFPAHATINILWLPVIAVVQYVFTIGVALIVACVNVFYRDVGNVTGHVIRLWWYLSPGLWAFDVLDRRSAGVQSFVGEFGYALLQLNPWAVILTAYRHVLYGRVDATGESFTPGQPPDLIALAVVLAFSCLLVLLGTLLFKRLEPAFAKVL